MSTRLLLCLFLSLCAVHRAVAQEPLVDLLKAGKFEEIEQRLLADLRTQKTVAANTAYHLAVVASLQLQHDKALTYYREAVQLDPDRYEFRKGLTEAEEAEKERSTRNR